MPTTVDETPAVTRRRRGPPARATLTAVVALGLASLVIAFLRLGADWPAQDFRASLAQGGLSVWTNNWYDGTPLPGYSVLYPLLAAVLGSSMIGLISATAAAAFGAWLCPPMSRRGQAAFCAAATLCVLECLLIGQVTFLLGVAFAAAALVALRAGRGVATGSLAALSSLASPLAGLFLLLGAAGLVRSLGLRRTAPTLFALAGSAVAAVFDSGGGPFTYRPVTLAAIGTCCVLILVLTDRNDRALRDFAWVYLIVSAAAFVVDNPIGSNLNRLGKLVVLPLAVLYVFTRPLPAWRRAGVLVGVGLAAWWSLIPAHTAFVWGIDDPGRHAAYYRGVVQFLQAHDPASGRVEVPFTRTHTESYRVARRVPIARGWERQVDLGENDVLYHRLTPSSYRRWLDENAVALVALSDLEPDIGGAPERDLLRDAPAYLRPVWSDAHWQVWRVTDPQPIADPPARVVQLGPASVRLHFERAGDSLVRVRSSPLWSVAAGSASLRRSGQGWLRVRAAEAGTVVLRARLGFAVLDPTNDLR